MKNTTVAIWFYCFLYLLLFFFTLNFNDVEGDNAATVLYLNSSNISFVFLLVSLLLFIRYLKGKPDGYLISGFFLYFHPLQNYPGPIWLLAGEPRSGIISRFFTKGKDAIAIPVVPGNAKSACIKDDFDKTASPAIYRSSYSNDVLKLQAYQSANITFLGPFTAIKRKQI